MLQYLHITYEHSPVHFKSSLEYLIKCKCYIKSCTYNVNARSIVASTWQIKTLLFATFWKIFPKHSGISKVVSGSHERGAGRGVLDKTPVGVEGAPMVIPCLLSISQGRLSAENYHHVAALFSRPRETISTTVQMQICLHPNGKFRQLNSWNSPLQGLHSASTFLHTIKEIVSSVQLCRKYCFDLHSPNVIGILLIIIRTESQILFNGK